MNSRELDPHRSFGEGLQQGAPEALARLYDENFDRVHAYVRRSLRDAATAEDLTHDIFLHVFKALPRFDPEKEVGPWLFTIAANKLRDHWRSMPRRMAPRNVSIDSDSALQLESEQEGPEEQLQARDLERRVRRILDTLPEGMRSTVELRALRGWSFDAIARDLGRNATAIRKRYSRALDRLRGELGPGLASMLEA